MTADPLRQIILKTIHQTQSGDIGLSLAMVDLVKVLYLSTFNGSSLLRYNVDKPQDSGRDRVIWSNGASWPALLAVLKEAGFDVNVYDVPDFKTPGVDMVMKDPGYGLAVALGIAASSNVFVFLDDDDLKTGVFWESVMEAGNQRLGGVVSICAHTGLVKLDPIQDKFEAFGWKVLNLVSGHDEVEIVNALVRAKEISRQPTLILAPTVLGKGVPFAEGKEQYRSSLFSAAEMQESLQFLT